MSGCLGRRVEFTKPKLKSGSLQKTAYGGMRILTTSVAQTQPVGRDTISTCYPGCMKHSRPSFTTEGFVAIPRGIFDLLLCQGLHKRELSLILLIVRLTYGCRNRSWAHLKQADLTVIGIGPTHAKTTITALLARNLIEQNGNRREYRLHPRLGTVHEIPRGRNRWRD